MTLLMHILPKILTFSTLPTIRFEWKEIAVIRASKIYCDILKKKIIAHIHKWAPSFKIEATTWENPIQSSILRRTRKADSIFQFKIIPRRRYLEFWRHLKNT